MDLLTDSRSSARSAPISYTPPVNPPPPRTRAVLEERLRRAVREPEFWGCRSFAPASRFTTLPIEVRSLMPRWTSPRHLAPALALALVLGAAAPAAALTPRQTATRLGAAMSRAGAGSGAYVVDLRTGEALYSSR